VKARGCDEYAADERRASDATTGVVRRCIFLFYFKEKIDTPFGSCGKTTFYFLKRYNQFLDDDGTGRESFQV